MFCKTVLQAEHSHIHYTKDTASQIYTIKNIFHKTPILHYAKDAHYSTYIITLMCSLQPYLVYTFYLVYLKIMLINIKFNGSKSHLLSFKGRNCKISTRGVTVNGLSLNVSETAVHLGHHMSAKDKECTVNATKNSFGGLSICSLLSYLLFLFIKMYYLGNIAVVIMSHLCGHCRVIGLRLSVLSRDRH